VEPVIREWEFAANLNQGPGEFELIFSDAVIEDRNPTPGVISVQAGSLVIVGESVSLNIGRGKYPEPPTGIAMNADVEAMALRYSRYRESKDTLAGIAYFLPHSSGGCLGWPRRNSGHVRRGLIRRQDAWPSHWRKGRP